MDATTLYETLLARGVTLEASGDKLRLRPASALTADEVAAVKTLKPAILRIIALLAPPPALAEPCSACGGRSWWRRPDGGMVCGWCHPDPSAPPRGPVDAVLQARDARSAWVGACFELAEALGWPVLEVRPGVDAGPGECPWRAYLTRAALPELRDWVLPALRERVAAVGAPDARPPTGH